MNILITVCARGGSKGIPGKNIKLLNGKPLIYYTLKTASVFADKVGNTSIYLSTDSEEIRKVVQQLNIYNISTDYLRPKELAKDSSGKMDAILDVKSFAEKKIKSEFDFVIDLDVTSPLRTVEDLEIALSKLSEDKNALNIFSVSHPGRNPYFNMVEEMEDGYVKLCKEGDFLTRQSAPAVFDMNASFYIYKAEFFQHQFRTAITPRSLYYLMPHICFDLDESLDFDFMEFMISNDKMNFNFIS